MSRYTASHRKRLFLGSRKPGSDSTPQPRSKVASASLAGSRFFLFRPLFRRRPFRCCARRQLDTCGSSRRGLCLARGCLVGDGSMGRLYHSGLVEGMRRHARENLAPSIAATLPHIGALLMPRPLCPFLRKQDFSVLPADRRGRHLWAQNAFLARCAGCQVVVGQSSARKSRRPRAARNREGRRLRYVEQHRQVVERRGQFSFASGPRIRTPWRRAASASLRSRVASGNSVSIASAR